MAGNLAKNFVKQATQLPDSWLIGADSQAVSQIAAPLFQELTQFATSASQPKILLAEPEPSQFLGRFIAAFAAGLPVFLGNPTWGKQEWQQVFDLVNPSLVWGQQAELLGNDEPSSISHHPLPINTHPLIMIPTGGSSGKIRFAIHTWDTLSASIRGFQEYFQVSEINSFCILPLYHVSGFMQFLRSFTTQGKLAISSLKSLEKGEKCEVNPEEFFISLVPTQLQRLLQNPELARWLSQFQTVLLGGAPAWPELLDAARRHRIRLAPTYGMTETASQIATLKPEDFLAGNNSSGKVLPHAQITICSREGEKLGPNQMGEIIISAESLALGYYPKLFSDRKQFKLDDLGYLDENRYLNIVGRSSDKIITGGENVFPAEVEAVILATGLVADACVIGLPDRHWGQVVTAIYTPNHSEVSLGDLLTAIQPQLSKFKQPKYWVAVECFPRNQQGKVRRDRLQEIALKELRERGVTIAPTS